MSFALTTAQFLDGSKDVTRRLGWKSLKPGTRIMAVKKAMGLKPGEKIERLGAIEIIRNEPEALADIILRPDRGGMREVAREGFPDMSPEEFVRMFMEHMDCDAAQVVNRIEFKRAEMPEERL